MDRPRQRIHLETRQPWAERLSPNPHTDGGINCERCEKCVRTKLSLLVVGVLERATAFSEPGVHPEEIRALWLPDRAKARHLLLHVPALRRLGRHDLAAAIERKTAREERRLRRRERRQRWRRLRARLGLRAPAADPRI